MRKQIQSYRGKLAKQLQELKIRLEALEAFERALYWNSLSDEQAQQCNICTLNDIVQSLNGLDDDVCCMKASLVQTLAELAENPAKPTACDVKPKDTAALEEQKERVSIALNNQEALINVYENYAYWLPIKSTNEWKNEISRLAAVHRAYHKYIEAELDTLFTMMEGGEAC